MNMIPRLFFCLLLSCMSLQAAAVYYVDLDGGNDASAGTSTNSPWRTIPGTRTTSDSGYLHASWGSITTISRIQDNTTIWIKSGTTNSSADGGYVWMTSASGGFWLAGHTNLVISRDPSWGSGGNPIFDGTGMTIGIGLILLQIDGVTFRGLTIKNSDVSGIQGKDRGGAPLTNITFADITLQNNGKSYLTDLDGSGDGQINIKAGINFLFTNCLALGNQQFINGFLCGDNHKRVEGRFISCVAADHKGDPIDNDAGIGFKALNGRLTFTNCISTVNLKGFDLGEQNGFDADAGSPANILYKVINCVSRTNTWGINFNGSADAYPGTINWYAINNLITDNADNGINSYAAPHNFFVVHNTFDRNGLSPVGTPLYNGAQITTTPNDVTDLALIHTYLFNNIFRNQKAGGGANNTAIILTKYFHTNNNYTLTSDYNSYEQTGGNTMFCEWSSFYGPGNEEYTFGVDGPGHASGNWYSHYGPNATPPLLGTGHFHCDVNSKGTGCSDPTVAPINSLYAPTNLYGGSILSTQSWYIAEMGVDASGTPRRTWDIGRSEYYPPTAVNAIIAPGRRKK
jgi:hypothetical protein